MDEQMRSALIGALAEEFTGSNGDLNIDTSNYIPDTGAMDCTARGLSLDTLEKTKRVIEQHEVKFSGKTDDPMSRQYISHLKVAKKCVEEIMSQKRNEK